MEHYVESSRPVKNGAWIQRCGSNQGGMREYNERVVLHAIRSRGSLPAADIARYTNLTSQTVSIITKRLQGEGLLVRGAPQRGRMGQPAVPLALNPDGAFAIGINIGRRSMSQLLVDFTGTVRERWAIDYDTPDPATLQREIGRRLSEVRTALGPDRRHRVKGIGIAAPLWLDGWQQQLGTSVAQAASWQNTNLRSEIAALTEWPVHLLKDTAAACVAELVAGIGPSMKSFLYIFIDTFVGGGLVIDGHLRGGHNGNAGAVGSLSISVANGHSTPPQMLSVASLNNLEQLYRAAGLDATANRDARALEAPWLAQTKQWLTGASTGIALAVHNAACLLDIDGVIVDGACSRDVLAALLPDIVQALDHYDWSGVVRPTVLGGTIGPDACAIGGALLPLYASFAPDRDLFLKLDA